MYEFRLADVGEGLHEAEIGAWLVAEGDAVRQDQPLLEIETDKATVEIPAPVAGTVVRLAVAVGEIAKVGDLLVVIDPDTDASPGSDKSASVARPPAQGEESHSTSVPTRPRIGILGPGERILASPVARKMAAELGVDLRNLQGSGPAGRIMTTDVEQAAARTANPPENLSVPTSASTPANSERVLAAPAVRKLAAEAGIDLAQVPGSAADGRVTLEDLQRAIAAKRQPVEFASTRAPEPDARRIPLRGVRRTIARRMEEAWRIPQVTSFDEFDARRLVAVREALRPVAEQQGVRLTFLPLIAKTVAVALGDFPNFNSSLDLEHQEIVQHDAVHLGVAAATDAGLLVPVVRNAETLSVLEIAQEIERLVQGAKDRSLAPAELTGSTFTITNFGSYGGGLGTPILNPPEAAILGIGRIAKRPTVTRKGKIKARFTLPLALTIDHRLLDGAEAGAFLARLEDLLVQPETLLLELR